MNLFWQDLFDGQKKLYFQLQYTVKYLMMIKVEASNFTHIHISSAYSVSQLFTIIQSVLQRISPDIMHVVTCICTTRRTRHTHTYAPDVSSGHYWSLSNLGPSIVRILGNCYEQFCPNIVLLLTLSLHQDIVIQTLSSFCFQFSIQ